MLLMMSQSCKVPEAPADVVLNLRLAPWLPTPVVSCRRACIPQLLPLVAACNTNALHVLVSEHAPSVLLLRSCNYVYPGKIVTGMTAASDAVTSHHLSVLLHCMACKLGLAICTKLN